MQTELTTSLEATAQEMTFEEYLKAYNSVEGVRTEWVNGKVEVYQVSNNIKHQKLIGLLYLLLYHFLSRRAIGQVLLAGVPMKIEEIQHAREPDLLVILNEHSIRIKETYLDGVADIVIEIVSPESDERDHGKKFVEYEAAGVPEYWLLDPIRSETYVYTLGADGRYRLTARDAQGRLVSAVLPGFALDPELLWRETLPSGAEVIRLVEAMG